MRYERFELNKEGSNPDRHVDFYLQNASPKYMVKKRPMILICPGGAYEWLSDREGEPMAFAFLGMGCHAAVVHYSTAPARFPTALMELSEVMLLVRSHAQEWHVDTDSILVLGSSAGGHLAASLGCLWHRDFLQEKMGLTKQQAQLLKPNGMILCYPVITSGEYAHRGSFRNLLGEQEASLAEEVSLEKCVTDQTPQTFLWSTYEDGSVPVENSLLFASALRKAGVPFEYHVFAHGGHGLALANEVTAGPEGKEIQPAAHAWVGLVEQWLRDNYPLRTEE